MGQGIQQPSVEQTSGGSAWVDVAKVLFEPGAVFERVRVRPSFLAPFLAIVVVQCVLFFVNLTYLKVALQAQMAASGRPVPGTAVLAIFGLGFLLVFLGLLLLLSGLVLWVMASIVGGGDAKYSTLLSVAAYSAVPSAILLSIIGSIVLHMQGVGQITSPQDLQPALGLDLLVSGSKGFVGALLKGINPFSIWGLVLMAIGVTTTQRMSKGSAYMIASVAFVVLLVIGAGLAALNG
jgi:hypothetical protein